MRAVALILFISWATATSAQLNHPKASPFARIEQQVGLTKIRVEYSRPSTKGRVIFGNDPNGLPGVVPYGRIWRVGANESTKITFDTDVRITDTVIPKGVYALYAFPFEKQWEIVFHKNTSHWGDGRTAYDSAEDALRLTVAPSKVLAFKENFMIWFDGLTHDKVNMVWQWAHTQIKVPITVDTRQAMARQIQEKLNDSPTAQTYYEIARYYQEQGIKPIVALEYVNKALALGGDTYYFHRVKSLAEAEIGDYRSAVASAEKSLALAQEEGKDEFVRMNQKNIDLWKRKLQD